ncbi:hypothetical protein [Roseovarius sp. E0-M6]|uniref:hypothetical protein n=1 Tax=Roseovarius sp. E0-M6 TaxID=3127118 RepID=UPI00300F7F47
MLISDAKYFLAALAVSLVAPPAMAQDSDGCFNTASKCISVTSKWKNDEFISYFTNNCQGRVYAKFCNQRENRSADCGASGIGEGRRHSWRTYSDATGRTRVRWVGSVKSSKDWVCGGKVPGWHDPLF